MSTERKKSDMLYYYISNAMPHNNGWAMQIGNADLEKDLGKYFTTENFSGVFGIYCTVEEAKLFEVEINNKLQGKFEGFNRGLLLIEFNKNHFPSREIAQKHVCEIRDELFSLVTSKFGRLKSITTIPITPNPN